MPHFSYVNIHCYLNINNGCILNSVASFTFSRGFELPCPQWITKKKKKKKETEGSCLGFVFTAISFRDWKLTLNNFTACARSLLCTMCGLLFLWKPGPHSGGPCLSGLQVKTSWGQRHSVWTLASEEGSSGPGVLGDLLLESDGHRPASTFSCQEIGIFRKWATWPWELWSEHSEGRKQGKTEACPVGS